jgi:hypothetical protein
LPQAERRALPPSPHSEFANGIRPYPGQLWKHDSAHVIVVAVHPNSITYEFLSGGQSVTQSLDVFLAVFTRLRR